MTPHGKVLLDILPTGPLVGAEVGVLRGENAATLLEGRPELLLYLVDTWQHGGLVKEAPWQIRRQAYKRLEGGFRSRIQWQEVNSLIAATWHADASLDFVFLDSCHEFDHVLAEIDAWHPKVKPGGILAGHDYGHPDYPGVKKAVSRRLGSVGTLAAHVWAVRR